MGTASPLVTPQLRPTQHTARGANRGKNITHTQHIEEEAWDGSIEKTVNVKHCLSHDENDDDLAEIQPQ